jgi:hypothetical protein
MTDRNEWFFDGWSLRFASLLMLVLAIVSTSRQASAATLAIAPPSATVAPMGTQMFTASGGSGMGYTWSLSTNMSGGSVSAAGLYTAGSTGGVVDQVEVTDSAMNTATAAVTVTSSMQVLPTAATVAAGAMLTLTASGGTKPYSWAITTNGSGSASITKAGVYTAGAMAGMDVITATDAKSLMATSTITVTVMKVGIGAMCTSSTMCPTGATCVDDVCCSSSCSGQCQACNTSGAMGTCVTITGPPVGTRSACPQSDSSNICTMMTCDGTSPTSCTSFVGSDTMCGISTCVDQVGTPAAVCEGDGGCQKVTSKGCGAYACIADQCATSCTDSAECSPGNYCKVESKKCVVPPPVPDAGAGSPMGGSTGTSASSGGCSIGGRPGDLPALPILMGLFGSVGLSRRRRRRSGCA